jgi:hypothetical protein
VIARQELDFARGMVSLILGIDEYYKRLLSPDLEGLAREGYVAVNLSKVTPRPVSSYAEARAAIAEQRAALARLDLAPGRKQYFGDYLAAIDTFCRWQDARDVPYPELVHSLLGCPGEPPPLEPLMQSIDEALHSAGYKGDTFAMIEAFREQQFVPDDAVVDTLAQYLAEAREWVVRELFPLPDDFQFGVVGVSGVPYNAYCGYVEREIWINIDLPFTREDLKHLACHEAYPGHSTQIARHEELVARDEMTEDGLLIVTDTPTTTLFEGIGEVGLTLLGWDRTPEEQINRRLGALRSAVGAWGAYLIGTGKANEAMDLMVRYGGERSAHVWKGLTSLPIRLPFVFAYYYGDQTVHAALHAAPDRRAFLHHLYDLNHSPASLVMP